VTQLQVRYARTACSHHTCGSVPQGVVQRQLVGCCLAVCGCIRGLIVAWVGRHVADVCSSKCSSSSLSAVACS
jgi:hypothetical protein